MNCEEIKNLLSEYLDGRLDDRARILVAEHLENCPECRREFEGLKDCLKEIGSLGKVEPPSDFLNQIHSRMEEQSVYKSAIKKIFFPIRFKIPLEAAGLAAAAVLLFYILNISPEKQSIQSVPHTASMRTREGFDKPGRIIGATKPIPYPKETMEIDRDHSPDRLPAAGMVIEPAAPPAEELLELEQEAKLSVLADKDGGRGAETVKMVLLIEPARDFTGKETTAGAPLLRMKGRSLQSSETRGPGLEEEKSPQGSSMIIRIKELITLEGGDIISTEDMADLTRRIEIKLPPDRYRSFLENLAEIGDLRPERLEESEDTIRFRSIRIIPDNL